MSTIKPFNKVTVLTATRFSLHINELLLNISATFRVSLYDADEKCIDNRFITIEGDDYKNWSNDDNYIINFVANKLGFVLIS